MRLENTVQMIDEPDDDRQRAEVARAHPVDEGADGAADALVMADALVAAVEQRAAVGVLLIAGVASWR